MDKETIKRRINSKIDEDDEFADNLGQALEAGNNAWILDLIYAVIGVFIEIGSSIWNWIIGK
jgi:hypothetical protein